MFGSRVVDGEAASLHIKQQWISKHIQKILGRTTDVCTPNNFQDKFYF